MKDAKAMAYVNMFAVLGALENLCEIDNVAKEVLVGLKNDVSLCFDVKDGPCATFHFTKKGCRVENGSANCNCKMNFASPEKFNDLIDNTKPGVPVKGVVTVLAFLLGPFSKLTDRLVQFLRASDDDLKDPKFFEKSTILTFYTIAAAITQLANNDAVSQQSALYTVDGDVQLSIKDVCAATVRVDNHHFTTLKEMPKNPRAIMEFADVKLANDLFNGRVSSMAELCKGNIRMAGMISMVDNLNRILDRVAVYLA